MGGFFYRDSTFNNYFSSLIDLMMIGVLWTLFSLPIITIGASTTAAYYVCTKKITGKDCYLFKSFMGSFFQNFINSTLAFLLVVVVLGILAFNLMMIEIVSNMTLILMIIQYLFLWQAISISLYVFPLISRFHMNLSQVLRTSFFMANSHFLMTLTNLGILAGFMVISVRFPILILFSMGIYCYLSSCSIVRVFRKYSHDFDKFNPVNKASLVSLQFENNHE